MKRFLACGTVIGCVAISGIQSVTAHRQGQVATSTSTQLGGAVGEPSRIDTIVAVAQVTKRVEPVFSADVVAANPGAVIAADVIVKVDGTVESVRVVTGPQVLRAPVVAALQQWAFRPFLVNGRTARVVAMIDFALANPREETERKRVSDYFDGSLACERSIATRTGDAEAVCAKLVALSEPLDPSRVLERIRALQLHGLSLLIAGRAQEALARFEPAIEARRRATGDADADLAALIELAAQAEIGLRNLPEADRLYASSVATFERAIAALPSERDRYVPQLGALLGRYAELKRAMGQPIETGALEARVAAAPASTSIEPLPPIQRNGSTVLLGSIGPMLTADDLRQLRAMLPPGKKAWLIIGQDEALRADRQLNVEVFADADHVQPNFRRGVVISAQAKVPSDAALDAKKTWTNLKIQVSYAQIPLPGRDVSDIRGNDDANRPILISTAASSPPPSDAEIVSLVAFIRSVAGKGGPVPTRGAANADLYVNVQSWPIEDITKWSDGNIDVRLVENKTVARRAQMVKVKPEASSWTIVQLQPW